MQYEFDWSVIWRYRGTLLHGLALTVLLSLAGLLGALLLGMIGGTAATSRSRAFRGAALLYVELARNIPLLVHIYFWYLALSFLRLPAFWCGVLALAIYSGAYVAEIVRAGIQSVPSGQRAAALALGLAPAAVLRYVVYPQALRIVAPSLAGIFSQLIKDSSLASVISVAELTFAAGVIEGDTFRTFEAYISITLLYFLIVTAVSRTALLVFGRRGAEVDRRF
jgi:His/Glu/Gln/Arg/opine family amino acid ABC transporter permease subunit